LSQKTGPFRRRLGLEAFEIATRRRKSLPAKRPFRIPLSSFCSTVGFAVSLKWSHRNFRVRLSGFVPPRASVAPGDRQAAACGSSQASTRRVEQEIDP
jgi:hypothetical protein